MANPKKTVLMTQTLPHQGEIWHGMLTSQEITVIWESIDADLMQVLMQMHAAGLTLPDLLLVDMGMRNLNPYTFCQSCRQSFPHLNIVLTVGEEKEIAPAERQWAIYQGAKDLFPGIQPNGLLTSAIAYLSRILELLNGLPMHQDTLMPVLAALSVSNNNTSGNSTPTSPPQSQPCLVQPASNPEAKIMYRGVAASPAPTVPPASNLDDQPRRRYRGSSY